MEQKSEELQKKIKIVEWAFTEANYKWKAMSMQKDVFRGCRYQTAKSITCTTDNMYVFVYRAKGKRGYIADTYLRIPFAGLMKLLSSGGKYSKSDIKKVFDNDLKEIESLPDVNPRTTSIFMSLDAIGKINGIKGMPFGGVLELPKREFDALAVGLCSEYKGYETYYMSDTLMDVDRTPNQVYAILPLYSVDINKPKKGSFDLLYDCVDARWLEYSMSSLIEWMEDNDEDDDDDSDGSVAVATDKKEDEVIIPIWENPFSLNDVEYGKDETGKLLFTKKQFREVDRKLLGCIDYLPIEGWIVCDDIAKYHEELKGLDHSVCTVWNGMDYVISKMYDTDGDFFFFSCFSGGKKVYGKVIKYSDYANYMLCSSRMKTTDAIFKVFSEINPSGGKAIEKTSSRKAGSGRKKSGK